MSVRMAAITRTDSRRSGRKESVDWHDLLDILEANGGHCDCEVVLNLPDGTTLQSPTAPESPERGNPWLLPPDVDCEQSAFFTKVIVCQAGLGRNTYAREGELLVPAPKGASRAAVFANRLISSSVASRVCQPRSESFANALKSPRSISPGKWPVLASRSWQRSVAGKPLLCFRGSLRCSPPRPSRRIFPIKSALHRGTTS